MKRVLYLLIVSLLVANCWQPSDKKENNEATQANDIKENPKEDFDEEEMPKQSNDTIITPKDVQVNEDGTIFYDHHQLIYIEKISELIKRIENTKIFILKKSYKCDLNQDNLEDTILVFFNKHSRFNQEDIDWTVAPIIVLLNKGNKLYKMSYNSTIYPNSFDDYFSNITIKNNFFTIELGNVVPDSYDYKKYITFKYDKQKECLLLHRYGEIINWYEKGESTNTQLTTKDFGGISFEKYDDDTINDLIYKVMNK